MSVRSRLEKLERAAKRGPGMGLAALLAYDDEHPREPLTRATVGAWRREGWRGLAELLRSEDFEDRW